MSRYNLFFLGLLLCAVSACSSDVFLVHNGNMPAPEKIAKLEKGQTKQTVAELLGSPSSIASFDDNTWIYMSSTVRKFAFLDPKVLQRNILTIEFDNKGKVRNFAEIDESQGRKVGIDQDETEIQTQDVGFFKKYFGGVGAYMPIAPTKEE